MHSGPINVKGGAAPQNRYVNLINRSGATLTQGDLVALNLDFAATAGQAMVGLDDRVLADGATGYVYGSAIAVTTANALRKCLPFFQGADGATTLADNAVGQFMVHGIGPVNMNGANAGEYLTGTNAQKYATPLTTAELQAITTNPVRVFGLALEATTGAQVKRAEWDMNGIAGLIVGVS